MIPRAPRLALAALVGLLPAACRGGAPAPDGAPAPARAPSPAEAAASADPGAGAGEAARPTAARPPAPPPAPWTLPAGDSPTRRVFFAEGGRHLITAEAAGQLRIWDLERRGPPVVLVGHVTAVEVVALAPGGRLLASAAGDGSLQLWFLEEGLALDVDAPAPAGGTRRPTAVPGPFNPPVPLPGVGGRVLDLAFDPGGRRLAAGADDGRAWLWEVDAPSEPRGPLTHEGAAVGHVAFDRAGARLLTLAPGRAPRLWAVDAAADPPAPVRLGADGPARDYVHAAFAADDGAIALLTREGALELWRGDGGERLEISAPPAAPSPADARAIWGPFGGLPPDAPAARLWPPEPDRGRFAWPVSAHVVLVDDAGARILASSGAARALRLAGAPIDVAFAGDGLRLATVEAGGRARVWRTGGLRLPPPVLKDMSSQPSPAAP